MSNQKVGRKQTPMSLDEVRKTCDNAVSEVVTAMNSGMKLEDFLDKLIADLDN